MPNGKVEVKFGTFSFAGEGEETWLASQLDKILEHVPAILKLADQEIGENGSDGQESSDEEVVNPTAEPLGTFLKNKKVGANQTQTFLATAIWLRAKGKKILKTGDVVKALADNHQNKLKNASQCLNDNVKKGFCEKQGKDFYITPQGLESIGSESAE